MYVDAAYSYRQSSMLCPSVTVVSPAKMVQPIEMLFGLMTVMGPTNHVLDGGPDSRSPIGRPNFEGNGRPIVKYRNTMQ